MNETSIRISRATPDEAPFAYSLVAEYYEAVQVQVRESFEEFVALYFPEDSGLWLAMDGATPAGCIALHPLAGREASSEIKRLYVRPEFRGRGLAAGLLAALEGYARQHGCEWLYLDTKDDLKDALRFYARQGYQPCERYNSNPQATVFMRKRLT